MTDRRDEEHKRMRREREARESRREQKRREQEADESRREDVEKRFDDLKEAWRRHHPSEEQDTDRDRPQQGRGKPA
jgi:hypothetical protein